MNRLCIGGAIAVFCASTLTGCGGNKPKANDVEMPTAPMEAPKLQPAPEEAGSDVSKFKIPGSDVGKFKLPAGFGKMPLPQVGKIENDVTWVVSGLPYGCDCTKAMQAILDGVSTIDDPGHALLLEAEKSCLDVVSKIETIWLQVDFEEGSPIKSMKGVIDVDGAKLVNLIEGKGEKVSSDHIDGVHFDLQGLSKATMWVDVSQEFMKSLKVEVTLDEAVLRSRGPGELRDVAASSLSRAKLLTSDLLFSFAPGTVVPSSVVQRRLSPPVRSLADLTPVLVPSATEACFIENPAAAMAAMIGANIVSLSYTIGGMSPQSACCTKMKAESETPEEVSEACQPEMQNVKGVWAKAAFTPSETMPLTGASGFVRVDGATLAKMGNDGNGAVINVPPANLERLYAGFTHSKAEVWVVTKDYPLLPKAAFLLTLDEAKIKEAAGKFGGFEHDAHMEKVLWQLVSQAPLAAAMTGMAAAAPLAKTEVDSQSNVGAVSLVGSLALLATVAGALTTRSRRQARSVQNVGAAESATELTTQEVA